MISILIQSILCHFAFTAIVFLLGFLLLLSLRKWFPYSIKTPRTLLFWSLLLGITTVVVIFSILKTNGRTVNILAILILVLFAFDYARFRKSKRPGIITIRPRDLAWFLPEVFLVVVGFSILGAVSILKSGEFPYSLPYADFNFYAEVSNSFLITGIENKSHFYNLFSETAQNQVLYHYFELWSNAFVQFLFAGIPIVNFFTVTMPFFCLLSAYGIVALGEKIQGGELSRLLRILFILFAIIAGCFFYFFGAAAFFQHQKVPEILSGLAPNFFVFYYRQCVTLPFFSGAVLLLLTRSRYFIYLLGYIPVASASAMPGIYGGFMLLGVIGKYLHIRSLRKGAYYFLAGAVLMMAFLVFYKVASGGKTNAETGLPWHLMLQPQYYVNAIKILCSELLMLTIFLSWVWGPASLVYARNYHVHPRLKGILAVFGAIWITSMVAWGVYNHLWDGQQLFTNLAPVLFVIVVALTIAVGSVKYARSRATNWILAFALFLAAGTTIFLHWKSSVDYKAKYSDEYLIRVGALKPATPFGVAFEDPAERTKLPLTARADKVHWKAQYVVFFPHLFPPVNLSASISDFENVINPEYVEILKFNVFLRYIQNLKSSGSRISFRQAQLQFIKEKNISYAVILPGAEIPDGLDSLIVERVTDTKSGESFVILDKLAVARMETEP